MNFLIFLVKKNETYFNIQKACKIGDEGVKYLCEAFKSNHTIYELNLKENSIGHKGCVDLNEMLLINKSIQILNLESKQYSKFNF